MAVVCSSLITCLLGMLLKCCLNDFEIWFIIIIIIINTNHSVYIKLNKSRELSRYGASNFRNM
jgi:hypothetical protein